MLKLDIARARGQALLLETTAAGWGTGISSAPRRDWASERLGPNPPAAMGEINQQIYAEVLAACGCSVAMFDDSDGTSKREAERIWLHSTVRPLGKLLASELSERLETPVDLNFDQLYMHDLSGRAASFMKLVSGGMTLGTSCRPVWLDGCGGVKRCAGCLLASLASRAARKRSRKERPGCADCGGERPPETRSPRCDACRKQHYQNSQNRAARERGAWAREGQEVKHD